MSDSTEPGEPLDYLYKEYVRLLSTLEQFVRGSFEDFKLLGAVGFVAAWPPVAGWLSGNGGPSLGLVLLAGFSVILVLVAIIATRDLLKQSLMEFHLLQISDYERLIRARLGLEEDDVFTFTRDWRGWRDAAHHPIGVRFAILFVLVLIVFPIALLAALAPWYVLAYAAIAAGVLATYESARRRLLAAARERWIAPEAAARDSRA